MAIPMVLGLIVVAGILGTTIWMSGRVGSTRVKQTIEILQLTSMAEAGITSGYSRLKQVVLRGVPLEQVKINYFKIEIPLKSGGKGICEGEVSPIGKGKFRITSIGKIEVSKGKRKRSKVMNLSAIAKVRVSLTTHPYDSSKLIRHYKCSLSSIKREKDDTK